jgi:Phospholipase_D-nuclease N-terminal
VLFFDGFVGLALLGLWLFCLLDVITSDESECRNLPKFGWLVLVLILPDVGSIIWLIAGRPLRPAGGLPDAPGRSSVPNPDDDEEFLRKVRERAEQQRRKAREQQPPEE